MELAHARDLLIPLTPTEILWLSVSHVEWVNLERARVPLLTYGPSSGNPQSSDQAGCSRLS